MKKWQTLNFEYVFDTPWTKVRKDKVVLHNGKIIDDYYLTQEQDAVYIAPITKEGKFIFCRQYKHGVDEITIELPAGYMGKNEKYEETARRELQEETGYSAEKFTYIGKLTHHPAKELGLIHVVLAEGCHKVGNVNFDETEEIEVIELTKEEVLQKIETGEIWATGTIALFFMAMTKLKKLNFSTK